MLPDEPTWHARAAVGRRGPAAVWVRGRRFTIGVPLSFDIDEPDPTALEHVLGAIAADAAGGFAERARRRRLDVESVEAAVEAKLDNPLTYLAVVGEERNPALKSVRVRVYITTSADQAAIEEVWRDTLARSPLVSTFARSLDLELTYKTML
ncbi:MAG: OsmC family protein [Acidobacteria bacterium]|nr:OsmC family protein [Acidobacteriota bacterium]